ncbi:MAG: hypothetical protein BEN18_00965 [Epulopiscium sp. Nuni2H_MBin001]|nr:MAG: hypothetical protein BEN18_00965 [Epulopiscium sp. Nuni2H_MBin001]
MISFKKQMFSLFLILGLFVVVLVSVFVNTTMHREFQKYVASNVEYIARNVADKIMVNYHGDLAIMNLVEADILNELRTGKCAISILDRNKDKVIGVGKEELIEELYVAHKDEYPVTLEVLHNLEYVETDIPILSMQTSEIVAFVRTGYFPSLLLSMDEVGFQDKINSSIVLIALGTISCSTLFALYLTTLFSKPIYGIVETALELSKGNYKVRYNRHSNIKEVETLRQSMNNLAQQLEEEDNVRKKLISDVSHEIRTPLHILQSNLEAMIDGIYPTDEEQMQALHKEVVRFSNLLSNLDKLKGIEESRVELSLIPVGLNQELQEVFNTFKIRALSKQLDFTLNMKKSEQVVVNLDVDAFKQIMTNLLSNAFKFTEAGAISIKTEVKGKLVTIEIKDTGIGINREDQKYMFDRMYRGDKSREQYEGSGIGLTIVKKLIVQLNGEIKVRSREGHGTTMLIQLPIYHNSERLKLKFPNA